MIKLENHYNKLHILILLAIILTSCGGESTIQPSEVNQPITNSDNTQTQTGFYWPTGTIPPPENNWLGSGCNGNTGYFKGEYHIGRDILGNEGDNIFAISDGEILLVSKNGWGNGNVATLIAHKLANGDSFMAVYGHIRTNLKKGDRVVGGKPFATIGYWAEGAHLHFGVRPDTSLKDPYGRMRCPYSGDTNGFVDPIEWITTKSPEPKMVISSAEITKTENNNFSSIQQGLVIANDQGFDEDGNIIQTLDVQFSNNKKTLSLLWNNGLLRNYEIGSFDLMSEMHESEYSDSNGIPSFGSISLSPDGKKIATGGFQLAIWDVMTGKLIKKYLPNEINGFAAWDKYPDRSRVEQVSWSPDGDTIAFDDLQGRIVLLDVNSKKIRMYKWNDEPECDKNYKETICDINSKLIWSPNGKYIAVSWGEARGGIYNWKIIEIKDLGIKSEFITCVFDCFSWSHDSKFFTSIDLNQKSIINIHDTNNGEVVNTLNVRQGYMTRDVFFVSEDKMIVGFGPWEIWDVKGNLLESFDVNNRITSIIPTASGEPYYLDENWWLLRDENFNFYIFKR